MSDEADVLARNEAFYLAFSRRDIESMEHLWAERAPVACIHPGWDALRGRADVIASWRAILTSPGAPAVRAGRATAHLCGEFAYVICDERVGGSALVATNVFVREDGVWKLIHHQAGPVARRSEVLAEPKGRLN